MKASGCKDNNMAGNAWRSRLPKIAVPALGMVLAATAVTASTLPGTSGASTTKTTSATKTKAAPKVKQYLVKSGSGDKVLSAVKLPGAWTVGWTFDCQSPSTKGTFALSTTASGGTPVSVTSQTGLGGGGHKPFNNKAGSYGFAVSTTCGWKVTVGSTPVVPVTASTKSKSVATTTTKPGSSTSVKSSTTTSHP